MSESGISALRLEPVKNTKFHRRIKKRPTILHVFLLGLFLILPKQIAMGSEKLELDSAALELNKNLIEAAGEGDLAAVKTLLEKGADVNGVDILQRRALPLVAGNGHLEVVEFLLEKGADIDATDQDCLTPLMNAAERGHLDVAKILLDKGADVNAQTKSGSTALRKAINGEYLDVVRLLLENGADVKEKLNDGAYILMHAAMSGNVDIVKAILDKGADINVKDERGSSALTWAAFMDNSEVVTLLRSQGAKSDLWIASMIGDIDEVRQFIDEGADVNVADGLHSTPLMHAAQKGRVDIVGLLLVRGADPTKKVRGRTAYDHGLGRALGALVMEKGVDALPKGSASIVLVSASGDGRIDVVKKLLDNGVDVNEGLPPLSNQYGQGFTPLMAACVGGHTDVARVLLENGADINQKDAEGDTALIHAAIEGELAAIKFLLDNGVDINQRGAEECTALIRATAVGEMQSVRLLLTNGADVNAVDYYRYTALNMNCKGPIHELLKAHGANAYMRMSVGSPPRF